MSYKLEDVKTLRELMGAGIKDCKDALTESNGDMDQAKKILRERGIAKAEKKSSREATEGAVVFQVSADNKSFAAFFSLVPFGSTFTRFRSCLKTFRVNSFIISVPTSMVPDNEFFTSQNKTSVLSFACFLSFSKNSSKACGASATSSLIKSL